MNRSKFTTWFVKEQDLTNRIKFNTWFIEEMDALVGVGGAADFGVPFCPDCYAPMVKSRLEDEEGNWARHWLCECKVGPPEDMMVPEDDPQVAEENRSAERVEENCRAALYTIATMARRVARGA